MVARRAQTTRRPWGSCCSEAQCCKDWESLIAEAQLLQRNPRLEHNCNIVQRCAINTEHSAWRTIACVHTSMFRFTEMQIHSHVSMILYAHSTVRMASNPERLYSCIHGSMSPCVHEFNPLNPGVHIFLNSCIYTPRAQMLMHSCAQTLKQSSIQTLEPSSPQTLQPSNPATLKPSNPQALKLCAYAGGRPKAPAQSAQPSAGAQRHM